MVMDQWPDPEPELPADRPFVCAGCGRTVPLDDVWGRWSHTERVVCLHCRLVTIGEHRGPCPYDSSSPSFPAP